MYKVDQVSIPVVPDEDTFRPSSVKQQHPRVATDKKTQYVSNTCYDVSRGISSLFISIAFYFLVTMRWTVKVVVWLVKCLSHLTYFFLATGLVFMIYNYVVFSRYINPRSFTNISQLFIH